MARVINLDDDSLTWYQLQDDREGDPTIPCGDYWCAPISLDRSIIEQIVATANVKGKSDDRARAEAITAAQARALVKKQRKPFAVALIHAIDNDQCEVAVILPDNKPSPKPIMWRISKGN